MLISLVIQLVPEHSGSLPSTTGPAMHGLFFKWLAGQDASLSARLHDLAGPKPFTVSALQPLVAIPPSRAERNNDLILSPQAKYWFRMTSIEAEFSRFLLEYFYAQPPSQFEILKHRFEVERVIFNPQEHPWAATSTFAGLNEPVTSSAKVKLQFHSPTTFKAQGRSRPLPLPEQTFNSLLTRWNNYASQPIDPAFSTWVSENLAISGYELRTELALMEGSRQGAKLIAFRGWCEYTALQSDPAMLQTLHQLARFAFFSGVGYKTTMGFGQTRCL